MQLNHADRCKHVEAVKEQSLSYGKKSPIRLKPEGLRGLRGGLQANDSRLTEHHVDTRDVSVCR